MLIHISNTILKIKMAKPLDKKSDFQNGVAFFLPYREPSQNAPRQKFVSPYR
jgi:hypothetical protein